VRRAAEARLQAIEQGPEAIDEQVAEAEERVQ
jgi:hypothetical protein